jgi:hypothetical protein
LFIDETDEYAFDDRSEDITQIEIAGDYWPSFRMCKGYEMMLDAARHFYASGDHPKGQSWLHFSEN